MTMTTMLTSRVSLMSEPLIELKSLATGAAGNCAASAFAVAFWRQAARQVIGAWTGLMARLSACQFLINAQWPQVNPSILLKGQEAAREAKRYSGSLSQNKSGSSESIARSRGFVLPRFPFVPSLCEPVVAVDPTWTPSGIRSSRWPILPFVSSARSPTK